MAHTDILLAVVLGFGLSALFKLCCDSRKCIVYRAPVIEHRIIRHENKCYQPTERAETCDSTKTLVEVHE